jgi:squalene synthase HpnC
LHFIECCGEIGNVTRGATQVSHERGPLSAPGPGRWRRTAVAAAPGPPAPGPAAAASAPARQTDTADITAGAAGQASAENFPVALRLLPARYRRHLMAVYTFARTVDDVGDETLPAHRLELLDELDDDLGRLYRGETPHLEVIAQLDPAIAECGIPARPFRDLIQANRQDQIVARYQTFAELAGYCELSANPVGRIVLYVFGDWTPRRARQSDKVCTALQLAEHWQDVAEDYRNGRVYLPAEDLDRFGCTDADLAAATASRQLRALMSFQVTRASAWLSAGSPLIGSLRGAARLAVAGYVAGGRAALAAIEAADHDVLAATRKPAKSRLLAELARAYTRGR